MSNLRDLLDLGEGYMIEFKESIGKDLARELVAFANASGGRILLGVSDKGEIKGFASNNTIKSRIQDIARNCDPSVDINIDLLDKVLVVNVSEGENKPYSCKSGFYLRQGPNSQRMSRDEILDLAVYEGHIKFDHQINSNFTYPDDFDIKKFEYYLRSAGIDKTDSNKKLLHNLGVLNKDMKLNNTGVLFFAKEPGRFIRSSKVVCCLFGHSRAKILDRKEFDGGIIANIEEATNYVTRHIDVRYEIKELHRKEIPEYPIEAYREAVVNAVLHRDYFDISGDVVIEVHKRALRISNPGGLVKGLNQNNFGKESRPRNRLMADLLLRTDFVEKLGTGISRIRNACEMIKLPPPAFEFDDYNFSITIRGAIEVVEAVSEGVDVPVKSIASNQEFGLKFGVKFGVKGDRLYRMVDIILSLYEGRSIDLPKLATQYGISKRMIEKDISFLRREGLIVFEGAPKTGKYTLTEKGKKVILLLK
jgi:ATP-dependent DNA helicase RecG